MNQNEMNLLGVVIFGTSWVFTRDVSKSFLITAAYGLSSFILIEDSKNKPIPAIQEIKPIPVVAPRPPSTVYAPDPSILIPPAPKNRLGVYNSSVKITGYV